MSSELEWCLDAPSENAWQLLAWGFLSLSVWLVFLLLADTLERAQIFRAAKKPMGTAFRTRAIIWLFALMLAACAAWLVWSQGGWLLRADALFLYCCTLLVTMFSWRYFWVLHGLRGAVLAGGAALLWSLATLVAFALVEPGAAALYSVYVLAQLYEVAYNWMFYRLNAAAEIHNRPCGRFQDQDLRRIADVFFVDPQQPVMHTVPTTFAPTGRTTLGDEFI